MMDMEKIYLVSDLASELGVPRTTVNDWLRIYGDYLESDIRGKRKVYPARTLAILQEIKAMREQDRAQGEIERFLADKYGIRPEPVAAAAPTEPPAPETAAEPAPASDESAAPPSGALVRPDPELRELFQRMLEQETERRTAAGRAVRGMFGTALALLVLLMLFTLGIAYYFHTKLAETEKLAAQRQESADQAIAAAAERLAELRKTQEAARTAADEHAKKLAELTVTLDRARQDYRQESAKLKSEIADQKQAADRALEEMKKTEEGRRAAEIAELRRTFAAGQTALLKELEAAKAAREQAEAKKSEAEKALAELRSQAPTKSPVSPADTPKPAEEGQKP